MLVYVVLEDMPVREWAMSHKNRVLAFPIAILLAFTIEWVTTPACGLNRAICGVQLTYLPEIVFWETVIAVAVVIGLFCVMNLVELFTTPRLHYSPSDGYK